MLPSKKPSKSILKRGLRFMRPIHREIARRIVLGQRQCNIARELNINQSRLSLIVNSPVFKEEVRRLEAERDKILNWFF